jgi:2-methylcitrate dehydratase PrpD
MSARCLRHGTVGLDDFTPEALGDLETLALARRLSVIADANPDPNALHPLRVELDLADGTTVACDVTEVLGSPARPFSPDASRAKFAACGAPATLWDAVAVLDRSVDLAPIGRPVRSGFA